MKVAVTFTGRGMRLELTPEGDAEQKMVGAVLNAPDMDRQSEVVADLVRAEISYSGHWTNKHVSQVRVYLHRDESPKAGETF